MRTENKVWSLRFGLERCRRAELEMMVESWNEQWAPGTPVRVLLDDLSFRKTKTRGVAWMASYQPLVLVEGISGVVSLFRVAPEKG
jgi:hypothetical protein